MRLQGRLVGREQKARVRKTSGITGVKRGKMAFTTKKKKSDSYPADMVQRRFQAEGPNQLWVADITYVPTWTQVAYVTFVTDVISRKIAGWSVPSTLKAEVLPLQGLDIAVWNVSDDPTGLMHYSGRGSHYVPLIYTDQIIELSGTPSVGSKGDSYKNDLAESPFALFKTELIKKRRPGEPSNKSNWSPWNECGGSTTNACTSRSAPCRKSRLSRRTTLKKTPR